MLTWRSLPLWAQVRLATKPSRQLRARPLDIRRPRARGFRRTRHRLGTGSVRAIYGARAEAADAAVRSERREPAAPPVAVQAEPCSSDGCPWT